MGLSRRLEVAALVVGVAAEDGHRPGRQAALVHRAQRDALHRLLLRPLELQQKRLLRAGRRRPGHGGGGQGWGRVGATGRLPPGGPGRSTSSAPLPVCCIFCMDLTSTELPEALCEITDEISGQ